VNHGAWTYRVGNLAHMRMVGEIDHPSDGGHLCEKPKGFLRAEIVERLHDVVGEKRDGRTRRRELMVAGNAERQVKLESRSLRKH